MTKRVNALGMIMLKERLTPPPKEAYSLHRKLSGAFLTCIKLKASVHCRCLPPPPAHVARPFRNVHCAAARDMLLQVVGASSASGADGKLSRG